MPGPPPWIFGQPTSWVLHEKVRSLSGDGFTVKDASGQPVMKADAKTFSIRDSFRLSCAQTGQELFTIKEEKMHRTKHYEVSLGSQVIATIRPNLVSMHGTVVVYQGEAKFNMMNKTDAPVLLTMKGGLIKDRNTKITNGQGQEVARSHEKRTNLGGVFGQDEYEITVQAGADVCLIIASMIVLDEIQEDKAD
eukprot:TRINITY_DN3153_c0_g1_i1.p1 TRINITY_DN3153_c0_g1~~TRINITY_DN3153_c0_g1_i1.p1  ORF type:complete len:193 (+),score=57.50 TRINITY_DN3153_c0_g1_i1:64-642(+)